MGVKRANSEAVGSLRKMHLSNKGAELVIFVAQTRQLDWETLLLINELGARFCSLHPLHIRHPAHGWSVRQQLACADGHQVCFLKKKLITTMWPQSVAFWATLPAISALSGGEFVVPAVNNLAFITES